MTEPEYFQALQAELHRNGPARPCLLLDLDRVDRNLDRVLHWQRRSGKHVRLVEKSLPCPALLDHLMQRACTRRLMSFHQPFLSQDAARFADADLLLGKPMPARAAAVFYRDLRGRFDPARQLQWLIDTPARLQQYLELARGLDTRMRINIEIDIGLHRGGVETERQLDAMMDLIAAHPNHLQWSGFMGYDPHVVALPRWAGSPAQLEDRAMTRYRALMDHARTHHAGLWRDDLSFNTAGSPSFALHERESLSTEVSIGSALVKPADFDLPTLTDFEPAIFIATPVLKTGGAVRLPGLPSLSRAWAALDPSRRRTVFIYGGSWPATPVWPPGLRHNPLYGRSANQEMLNAPAGTSLAVDDTVFLRPRISESMLLQFGDLQVLRGQRIVDRWAVFGADG